MSESSELIVHAVYKHNLDRKDEQGNQVYVPVYFENAIEDVRLSPFDEITNLDEIPEINYEEDDLMKYLQVREAVVRKLDNAKINKTEATTVATPNKLLYLDNASILQATAKNAQQLGGIAADKYALMTDLQNAEWTLEDIYVLGFEPIANLDSIPAVNYDSDTLMQFLRVYEAHIRKLDRDKVNKSDTVTTAAPNKILYLDGDSKLQATAKNAEQLGGIVAADYMLKSAATTSATPNKLLYLDSNSKLQATANNADKLGGVEASKYLLIENAPTDLGDFTNNKGYALKTDIPAVWNSSGHLVSPAGWKLYITN